MNLTRVQRWALLGVLSAGVLWLDIVTGPFIQFPIAFVIPVVLAAWHLGRRAALAFVLALVAGRLVIAFTTDVTSSPHWAALVNAAIRLVVLVVLADLVTTARQRQELAAHVQRLEGLLNICCVCKKIRREDGTWQSVEGYVKERSPVDFSHGLCETCLREKYPEYAGRIAHD